MSQQHEFFVVRAAEARRDAEAATLDNVRQRCLRAAEAWEAMAQRAERSERNRDAEIARKAALANAPQPVAS